MFKKYKSNEQLVDSRVQSDFSVWGSEFVNFLATVITAKMVKKADEKKLLDKFTYGELLDELEHIWRKKLLLKGRFNLLILIGCIPSKTECKS
ncbi:hypothetical protein [Parasutterella sp.]|uniref:hypothetical protein n=1 Tax=Parasutterella sp. TaxID=2049037 RepID=UPI003522A0D5